MIIIWSVSAQRVVESRFVWGLELVDYGMGTAGANLSKPFYSICFLLSMHFNATMKFETIWDPFQCRVPCLQVIVTAPMVTGPSFTSILEPQDLPDHPNHAECELPEDHEPCRMLHSFHRQCFLVVSCVLWRWPLPAIQNPSRGASHPSGNPKGGSSRRGA